MTATRPRPGGAWRGADPRPIVEAGPAGVTVRGGRCGACAHANPTSAPRCPRCGGETAPASFGPHGTVWATTTIHVGRGERAAPYTLAYVDLDDGPRILAHVRDGVAHPPAVADRVRLVGTTALGDVEVAR